MQVEDYLVKFPDLSSNDVFKLRLIVGEFRARAECGTVPDVDEFTSRFADISDTLRRKLTDLASGEGENEFTTTQTFVLDSTVGHGQVGRYRLVRILGEGAYGRVYLAEDEELLHQVVSVEPPPPRQVDDAIPAELERVCLKAICKRTSDRYGSAAALADDLRHWQQGAEPASKELPIVPRGLRSFGPDDVDFFLDLLPGPRNREGLPESIAFWKTRIEETDPDKTFSVGLIYGPSGCGKSSLMKAGLLPRLSADVVPVYVEATPNETERVFSTASGNNCLSCRRMSESSRYSRCHGANQPPRWWLCWTSSSNGCTSIEANKTRSSWTRYGNAMAHRYSAS